MSTGPYRAYTNAVALWVVVCVFNGGTEFEVAALGQTETDRKVVAEDGVAPPAAKGDQFTATFSNGVQVEFIGLAENPSQEKGWWAPDGTPLSEPPYARVPAFMQADAGGLAREICWRWIDLPEGRDAETRWGTEPGYGSAGGGVAFNAEGKQIAGLTAWAIGFDQSRDTCTLRLSVSVGATPWTTLFANDDGSESAMARTIDDVPHGVIFAAPRAEKGGTSITVSYQIPGKVVRLIAVDRDGLVDEATGTGGGALDFMQKTFHFANLSPDTIQRYELQTQQRVFQHAEFRNVSLHRGKQTKVEIVQLTDDEMQRSRNRPIKVDERSESAAVADAERRHQRATELTQLLLKEHGYRLENGQPLKRIPPPYSKTRDELWAMSSSPTIYRATGASAPLREPPPRPGFMVMHWNGEDLQPQSYHFSEPALQTILDSVFNLKLQDMQGDFSFLKMPVPGDWVLTWKPRGHRTNAEEIAALERVLREELKLPIRLKFAEVERPVYVATGSYEFTPVPGADGTVQALSGPVAEQVDGEFQIPLRRTNISASIASYPELLHAVGEVVLRPVIDEVQEKPKKENFMLRYHGAYAKSPLAPFDEAQVDGFITSMSAQTGLEFIKATRAVMTLVIERDAADE